MSRINAMRPCCTAVTREYAANENITHVYAGSKGIVARVRVCPHDARRHHVKRSSSLLTKPLMPFSFAECIDELTS